jgi:predicted aspartyl protease
MGTFYTECGIEHHVHRQRRTRIQKLLVDTGSEATWIAERTLDRLGVTPEKKDVLFIMANGQTVTRQVGFAVIRVDGHVTIDEVVFAQQGDLQLLGARTLDGLNLTVDSRKKQLVAAGPIPTA